MLDTNQPNYKPYIYTAFVAIIAVAGLGYYLMPTKTSYEVQGIPDVATTTPSNNVPDKKPVISISGNTLSVVEDNQAVQSFSLSAEGQFALHVLPSQPPRAFITDQDLNFDGLNDLGVLTSTGYSGVNYFYDYYIYNSATNRFDKNDVLVGLASVRVDASTKQIISTYKSGPEIVTNTYLWNGNTFSQIVIGGSAATNGGYTQNNGVVSEVAILEKARQVLQVLQAKDYEQLETMVSSDGLSVSMFPDFNLNKVYVTRDDVSEIASSTKEYMWGHYGGRGDPINLTLQESLTFSGDVLNADRVAINQKLDGTTSNINTLLEDAKDWVLVGFYVEGSDPNPVPPRWYTVYLIFDVQDGIHKLRGVARNSWTH